MRCFSGMSRLVLGLLLFSCVSISSANEQTILIIGDSLSAGYGIDIEQGWVKLLQRRLIEEKYLYSVINDSISGDTTSNGLARLIKALVKYHPEIVIIELGGNDGLRGITLASMRENLAKMIKLSQKAKAKVLLVGVPLPPNYGPAYIKQFQAVYTELAKTSHIPLANNFLDKVGGVSDLMQADGIHPNAKAQPQLLTNVWGSLAPLLKKN